MRSWFGTGGERQDAAVRHCDGLCERVEITSSGGQPAWRGLFRAMLQPARNSAADSLPYRDVLLTGIDDPGQVRARSLKTAFHAEFAAQGAALAARSLFDPQVPGTAAYFGAGVFAPVRSDTQVADLEFSWAQPGRKNSRIQTPRLGPGSGDLPAAWYAGQSGLALAFQPDTGPVRLELPEAASPGFRDLLCRSLLFIGRRGRASLPVIELHAAGSASFAAAAVAAPQWWRASDGGWQPLRLRFPKAADGGAPEREEEHLLWFRLTNRTGEIPFDPVEPPAEPPFIAVRGLIMPELGFSLSRWPFRRPSRWMVHFDRDLNLRSAELMETASTAVAGRLIRFGVYQHEEERWSDLREAFDAQQDLPLGGPVRVLNRSFPMPGAAAGLSRIYRMQEWSLLTLSEERPLGYFAAGPGELSGLPLRGAPLGASGGAGSLIGLDWLNRAAAVVMQGHAIGLADYWTRYFRTSLKVFSSRLEVETTALQGPAKSERHSIMAGARGALGPLYVEYHGGGS